MFTISISVTEKFGFKVHVVKYLKHLMLFFSFLFGKVYVEMRERWTNEKCNFQQYFSYIVAVSFICGGNRSTRRKTT